MVNIIKSYLGFRKGFSQGIRGKGLSQVKRSKKKRGKKR